MRTVSKLTINSDPKPSSRLAMNTMTRKKAKSHWTCHIYISRMTRVHLRKFETSKLIKRRLITSTLSSTKTTRQQGQTTRSHLKRKKKKRRRSHLMKLKMKMMEMAHHLVKSKKFRRINSKIRHLRKIKEKKPQRRLSLPENNLEEKGQASATTDCQ